jgi:hypothetical protein
MTIKCSSIISYSERFHEWQKYWAASAWDNDTLLEISIGNTQKQAVFDVMVRMPRPIWTPELEKELF